MTPIKYIDRTWLRRTIIVAIAPATIFIYLGTGVFHWGRDFCEVWRK